MSEINLEGLQNFLDVAEWEGGIIAAIQHGYGGLPISPEVDRWIAELATLYPQLQERLHALEAEYAEQLETLAAGNYADVPF